MRKAIRLVLLAWIGLAGLGFDARAQGTISAPGGVVAGRDIRESTINIGIPPDQVAVITEALKHEQKLTDGQRQTIAKLESNFGVSKGALRTFFRTLGENEIPAEQQEAKLVEIAKRYKQLVAQVAATPGDDPEIAKLEGEAKAALDAGTLEQADDLLGRVLAAEDASLERRQLEAAATAAQRGEIALTRLRYREAAQHFAAAAQRVPPEHEEQSLAYLDQEALALYRQGHEFGDNPALADAIDRYRGLLKRRTRERVPLDWAMTQNGLGYALKKLGEREIGTARLEEAVEAFRAALQELPRERVPLDWAMTQNGLGNALKELGERDNRWLEQAVEAYRAALQEYTRERAPIVWALIQNNLGSALWKIGESEKFMAVPRRRWVMRLQEAVQAYRAALQELPRERVPFDWAVTQNNLGVALATLGEDEQAVEAFRAALQEYTRERAPIVWAGSQNNLGNALCSLGERERGTARLEEAVQAYRAALEIFDTDNIEYERIRVQRNLQRVSSILEVRNSRK